MSQRSVSPNSDKNCSKRKKINKGKYEESERISESGQSKITHFFKNVEKKQKSDPKPLQKVQTYLQAELESLKEQQQQLNYEKDQLIQEQLTSKEQSEQWIRKSKYLIQESLDQIYENVRKRKGEIDPYKGFYDQNCRVFTQGGFGQNHEINLRKYNEILSNKEDENDQQFSMIEQFVQKQQENIKKCLEQLERYKQSLKNAHEQKTCKFSNEWPCLSNRYQVLELLGKGGFSQVYKAYDLEENRFVAIKKSSIEQSKVNLSHYVARQYENHIKLSHPNIAKLYEVLEATPNSVCISLQFCEGTDLSTYMKQKPHLPIKTVKFIMKQIFQSLQYLSSLEPKIIHYDLKPQNIMFSNGKIKILDFGLSKQIDNQHSKIALSNLGMGTFWYLPPESFDQKNMISEKVDIWSAGVIFYEIVFGRKPFGNNKSQSSVFNEGIILGANQLEYPDDIDVSQQAKSLMRHCLNYNPNLRYSATEALAHQFFK